MSIQYTSTRSPDGSRVSFKEALLQGLAPDGGLYLPTAVPHLDMASIQGLDFQETAWRVLPAWLEGVLEGNVLADLVEDAFDFPVPLVRMDGEEIQGDDRHAPLVLELFHGPTLSFKDFGARFLGRMLGRLSEEPVTILVATSGDTGSAVADGCSGIPGVRVVLLYPDGQVSPTQERQLIAERPGVTAVRVRGSFDDCQRMVKGAFSHAGLKGIRLTTANSINVGRLLPQMLYYIHAATLIDRPPLFVVPSGNLGNLTAGVLAGLSGMPTAGFLAAHNENDFFPRWLEDSTTRYATSKQTLSNAMDVGAPSNFERLELLFRTTPAGLNVRAVRVSDEETVGAIQQVWREYHYLSDPHTGVGLAALQEWKNKGEQRGGSRWMKMDAPIVVLSTAHPAKFPEIVRSATGVRPEVPSQLARLDGMSSRVQDLDANGDHLAELIRLID